MIVTRMSGNSAVILIIIFPFADLSTGSLTGNLLNMNH